MQVENDIEALKTKTEEHSSLDSLDKFVNGVKGSTEVR